MSTSRGGRMPHDNADDHDYETTSRSFTSSPRSMSAESKRNRASAVEQWDDEQWDDEETGLTQDARQRRKRRSGSVKDRVAGTQERTPKQEHKLADLNVLKRSAINVLLIGLWYFFSLSISIYNKWMFSEDYLDFHFPLFTTCLHMVVQFSLACIVLFFLPRFRPRNDGLVDPHKRKAHDSTDAEKPLMTPRFYLTRIGPCGAATGLDIGLGNMSLKFISLTFFTMCKSSALAFVLLFAFLFRLETPSIKLVLIIATMTLGVIMMVAGEAAFNLLGFVLIILSAFFSGFRWALTQILLLRNPATSNPFATIFFLAPIMFLSLLVLAVPIETFPALATGLAQLADAKGAFQGALLLLFPGALAFCMTSAEFALLQRTSVVTLSICGIFKEVVTISASQLVYHDPLTPINVSGLLVTIASIAAYNYIKIRKMRREARDEVKELEERVGMLAAVEGEQEEHQQQQGGDGVDARGGVTADSTVVTSRVGEEAGLSRERVSPTRKEMD